MNTTGPSPIRILRIITRLNIGGPSMHVALLTRLNSKTFATCLVVGRSDRSEGDLIEVVQHSPARIVRLQTLGRTVQPWADLVSFVKLLRIVWKERPHLIHTHMAKAGTLGRLAGLWYNRYGPGRRAGQRAVLLHTFHGHVLEGYFSPLVTKIFITIERWLARRTDCLIAVSQSIRDKLLAKGISDPYHWRVVPLGLDLTGLTQLSIPNGSSCARFGMVGRLVPIKNPRLFLDAFAHMVHQQPTLAVGGVIVGDGPLRVTLERDVKRLGLEGVVRLTGWQKNVRAVYENLDVACITSWNEGTPVALIEAMAAGRAVIATAVGGIPDVLGIEPSAIEAIRPGTYLQGAGGLLVRSGDTEGLAAALTVCAQDLRVRQSLGQAGRERVRARYEAARLIHDIEQLYRDAVAQRRDE